jgi:hypothetical protein
LRAKKPYKPWKPRNLVPWELRNLYIYVHISAHIDSFLGIDKRLSQVENSRCPHLIKVEGTIHLNETDVLMIRCSSILRTPSTGNWAGRTRGRNPLIKKDLKREASTLAFGRYFEGVDHRQLGSECQLGRKETPRERGTNKNFVEVKKKEELEVSNALSTA